ncbi:MAG: thioredoxin domain-containing protein [Bacteroidetes bacterium]|nr:thioredoxin domain-containing protein [Bacteroidota bacterium]
MPNRLIHESSPYLLQHAHNPVDWFSWSDEAWTKAKQENKLVLVSIGYSACHWCHVMEHESFENDSLAKIMNKHFVCIKVDREQRPDVDQVYMTAVQLMTGSGGWPLNCFTLPDGRPIFGGTYFPKESWMKTLLTLADVYKDDPEKVLKYAEELTSAVKSNELVPAYVEKPKFTAAILKECVDNWTKRFDNREGGPMKAPKFPLPNNYMFLLRQYYFTSSRLTPTLSKGEGEIQKERGEGERLFTSPSLVGRDGVGSHIFLTLEKMAYGGIYDQIGGGFARYSTDGEWKVPHFEKMLYDNAQLVSLYSEAYRFNKNSLYKNVVFETLEFIQREMTSPEGAFYSALDADSEGEEGKYYVWKKESLTQILSEAEGFKLFCEYFNVNEQGYWENENYILLRKKSDEEIAKRFGLSVAVLQEKISEMKKKVLAVRETRIKPGLDNKILTSWNALMIKGYADAYSVFGEKGFLNSALKTADYILQHLSREDGGLYHTTAPLSLRRGAGGEAGEERRNEVNGFLEDYAFTIEAFISLYQVTFDETWLNKARSLADYSIKHFHDPASAMFYFTSDLDTALIARKMEVQDNVIPSSNSTMARSLFYLGKYFDAPDDSIGTGKNYLELSEKMLMQVQEEISKYGSAYSNWAMLMQHFIYPFYEVAIVGKDVDEKRKELAEHFIPNAIFAGATSPPAPLPGERGEMHISLLENKFVEGKTFIYFCINKTCKQPTEDISEALKEMDS